MGIVKTAVPTFATLLRTGSNTVETLRGLLYADVPTVRIDHTTADDRLRTDVVERDTVKLEAIYEFGRESFREREVEIRRVIERSG